MTSQHPAKAAREQFNQNVAPALASQVDPRSRPWEGAADASTRFAYFESDDAFTVVAGAQEAQACQLALVYGLTFRDDRALNLVLPPDQVMPTAMRLAWLSVPVSVFSHGQNADATTAPATVDFPNRETVLGAFPDGSFVDRVHHLGDKAAWVEAVTAWAAAHPRLAPAHRPDNRSWHCNGLRVLRIARTPDGVEIRAGIAYSEGEGRPGNAITFAVTAQMTEDEVERVQGAVEAAIAERCRSGGAMHKPDEHWLQSVLRESPHLVGIEPPALREVAAHRCVGTAENGSARWARGFIDLVGADAQGSIRVVETKLGSYDLLVLQGLDYYIWAQRHRRPLAQKFGLPDTAPIELHFVVGGVNGGSAHLSSYIPRQLDALAPDIPWRVHFVEQWFTGSPDVREVHRHDRRKEDTAASSEASHAAVLPRLQDTSGHEVPWNDPRLKIRSDSIRTARYRALQSWYRETHLQVPPGADRAGRLIGSMLPDDAVEKDPGLNFLTPQAADYVDGRSGEVLAAGGTLEEDRLRRNMLSSMPMCFNIFGSLRDEDELAALVSKVFGIDAMVVVDVECEWAPDKLSHLNDRTAFDGFITYRDSAHRSCFLAIETKYTEPFSRRVYESQRYLDVTATSGYFRENASERLVGYATNQLWRMSMLAASLIKHRDFQHGTAAVLAPSDDPHAAATVAAVRQELVDPEFVKFVSLESLVSAASEMPALREWAARFGTRYLDLTPLSRR